MNIAWMSLFQSCSCQTGTKPVLKVCKKLDSLSFISTDNEHPNKDTDGATAAANDCKAWMEMFKMFCFYAKQFLECRLKTFFSLHVSTGKLLAFVDETHQAIKWLAPLPACFEKNILKITLLVRVEIKRTSRGSDCDKGWRHQKLAFHKACNVFVA